MKYLSLLLSPLLFGQIHLADRKADGDPGLEWMRGAHGLAVSPDGRHCYVPGSLDHGLTVFAIDHFSGELTFVEAHQDGMAPITSLASVRGVVVSPDGKHVYTAALTDSAVTVFSRDSVSGALTLVQAIFDLDTGGSFNGLGGAMSVDISPDGNHVYVGARSDDSIVAFSRDTMTGALALIGVYTNLSGIITGLDGVEDICVSPDGNHVYAAAETDQALAAFSRDPITGALAFVASYFDGVGGIDGLGCANELAISPDGLNVYAVGQYGAPSAPFCTSGFDDWLAVFSRNPATGALTYLETISPVDFNFPINCGGVASDAGVGVSLDGQYLYATVPWHAAIVQMDRNSSNGMLTPFSDLCADLSDPNAIIDLISTTRVTIGPHNQRLYMGSLSPGTALVFETDAYHTFREEVANWPGLNIASLLSLFNASLAP